MKKVKDSTTSEISNLFQELIVSKIIDEIELLKKELDNIKESNESCEDKVEKLPKSSSISRIVEKEQTKVIDLINKIAKDSKSEEYLRAIVEYLKKQYSFSDKRTLCLVLDEIQQKNNMVFNECSFDEDKSLCYFLEQFSNATKERIATIIANQESFVEKYDSIEKVLGDYKDNILVQISANNNSLECIKEQLRKNQQAIKNNGDSIAVVIDKSNDGVEKLNFIQESIDSVSQKTDYVTIMLNSVKDNIGPDSEILGLLSSMNSCIGNEEDNSESDWSIKKNFCDINKKIEVIRKIHNIKNLTISYKLTDSNNTYTRSDLLNDIEIVKDYKHQYINSNMMNKIFLTTYLDNLVKYNIKDKDLDLLSSNYNIPYMNYDNTYSGISKEKLYKYLDNKLTLSYTALENFYKCKFKYYISNILKINIIKDDFAILIGDICHYVLRCMDDQDFDYDTCFNNYVKTKREFSKRELFFLDNIKEELKFVTSTIKKQSTYSTFNKSMKEKPIYVNKDKNIKVTFMGVIDKVLYKEEDNITYLVVVDYKTGSTNINLKNMEYGLGLQLPIYLYLSNKMELKNIKVVGFYLQKLFTSTLDNSKDYETARENNLRLEGYSTDNENILFKFDTTYNDSKLIKGMKTTSKGFSTYSKVLNDEEIDSMINNTDKLINEGIDKILEGDFTINPKVIDGTNVSCSFCEYRDICYLREKDITYINREEDKDGEDV